MAEVKIAHGIFTWQDGRVALEACLKSTAPFVDEIVIADGIIDGVDEQGLPWFSDLSWLNDAAWLPERIPCLTKQWRTLSQACTFLLDKARELDCEWLLFVDADQELHNGSMLRPYLEQTVGPVFNITRQDRVRHEVPWQCIRVPSWRRYVAGCYVLEHVSGHNINLVPPEARIYSESTSGPWISHHPERRPAGRAKQRLGSLETILEPPPPALALHDGRPVLQPRP